MRIIFILILIYLVLNTVLSKKTCALYIVTLSVLIYLLYTLFSINSIENFFITKVRYLYNDNGDYLDASNNKIMVPVQKKFQKSFYNMKNMTNISEKSYTKNANNTLTYTTATSTTSSVKYLGNNSDNTAVFVALNILDDVDYLAGEDTIVKEIANKRQNICNTTAILNSSQKSQQKMYCTNSNNYSEDTSSQNGSSYIKVNNTSVKRKVCNINQIISNDNRSCIDCPSGQIPDDYHQNCIVPSSKYVKYNDIVDSLDTKITKFYNKLLTSSNKVTPFAEIMDKYKSDASLPKILVKLMYLFDTNSNVQETVNTNNQTVMVPLKQHIFNNLDVPRQIVLLKNAYPTYNGWLQLILTLPSSKQNALISALQYKDRKGMVEQIPDLYDRTKDSRGNIIGFKLNVLAGLSDDDVQKLVDDISYDSEKFVDYLNLVMNTSNISNTPDLPNADNSDDL